MRHIKRVGEEYYFGRIGEEMDKGCIFKIKNLNIKRIFSSEYILTGEEMILEVVDLLDSNKILHVRILFFKGEGNYREGGNWVEKNLSGNIRLWNYKLDKYEYIVLNAEEKEMVNISKSSKKFGI